MQSISAMRLRLATARAATRATFCTAAFGQPSRKTVPALFINAARLYATSSSGQAKVVAYTVDKFPGYVRNENFKKVLYLRK